MSMSLEDAAVTDRLVARAAAALRGRGERLTAPRVSVLAALAQQPGHPSAEDVVARVAEADPGVHRASVYRALEALTSAGLVQHIHLGHGATAYHVVPDAGPHPHAQCSRCGRVRDLPAGVLDEVAARLAAQDGFRLDADHVALSGVCSACEHAAEAKARPADADRPHPPAIATQLH